MLKKSKAMFMKVDDILYILGDDAFKFASLYHDECLRPMKDGVLNPKEMISGVMVQELIKAVAGEPKESSELDEDGNVVKKNDKADIVYFCVPANPIDANFDVAYHKQVCYSAFEDIGYENIKVITEGLAIVYSELAHKQYSGIGFSFGAGMVNVAFAYLGNPIFSFSISRSGDWIDKNAAEHMDETANVMAQYKESPDFDICNPKNNHELAVSTYYEELLKYLSDKVNQLFLETDSKKLPNITDPVDIVVAGGTSLPKGFIDKFKELVTGKFPNKPGTDKKIIPVGEVRHAENPLFAVCDGLYEAAEIAAEDAEDELD
jgi:actin-like ATPase involved in cell morphogenesis